MIIKMKKFLRMFSFGLALSLCTLTGLSVPTAAAETVTVNASGMDMPRGEGQLIIYTPAFGATTKTNEWGAEAVVNADHQVTEVGGNNSAIPQGGFVLSGHDTTDGEQMKTWVLENIKVGDYVYYNEQALLVTVSNEPIEIKTNGFYELNGKITGFDRPRYENNLIVYTPSFGSKTKTNEYGYEAVVQDGLIVSLGGNNNEIPKNGFVLSGHGTNLTWLQKNAKLGMRVEVDEAALSLRMVYNDENLKAGITTVLDVLADKLQNAKNGYLNMDYDAIDAKHQAVKAKFEQAWKAYQSNGNEEELLDAGAEIETELDVLSGMISESYPVQYRAVWVRPTQTSASEVEAYVKQLHDAGINTVCIEGNFNNTVIMNVPDGCLFEHNPAFSYDVLQAYIDACHKYGMECHLWMAIYLVGCKTAPNYQRSLALKKPEWISIDQNGKKDNEYGYLMIDPANEEARAYLLSFYTYLLEHYDIDCFQLDYIRYYDRSTEQDFGYTQAAFDGFEQAYHHGVKPAYSTDADYWDDWVSYRKSCVTQMVKEVRKLIDTYKPDVLLSADVVPSLSVAGARNYQDYPQWQKDGLLDLLHPMAYGDGYGEEIAAQVALGGDRCMVVTGLGIFDETLTPTDMVRQASEGSMLGTYGEAYFESTAYLKEKTGDVLQASIYRTQALVPFADPDASIVRCLSYMDERIENILLPFGGISQAEADALLAATGNAKNAVADSRIGVTELTALQNAIDALQNESAKAVLQSDLLRANRITCTRYRVTAEELSGELSLPDAQPFPEHTEPYAPAESETPSKAQSVSTPSESKPAESSASDETGHSPLPWILGIAGGALVIGAVALIIWKKKK